MHKSKFLTFCFAFIPGAGQMYLGMMKRGASLMLAFSVIIAVIGIFYIPVFGVLLPVIWFYSFFDTFNLSAMPYEQRLYMQDKFLFRLDDLLGGSWFTTVRQRHGLVGGILIATGVYLLYNSFIRELLWQLEPYFPYIDRIINAIPTCVVALAIIVLGIRLVAGPKNKPALPDDDFVQYGGENEHDKQ